MYSWLVILQRDDTVIPTNTKNWWKDRVFCYLLMNNKVVTIPEEVSGTHEEGKQKEEAPGSPKVIRRAQKPGHRRRLHPLSCHFPLHDVDQTTILQGCQITPWKAQGNKHKAFMPHKAPIPWPETLNRWKREKKQQSSLDLKNGEPTTEKSKIVAPRSNENLTTHAPSWCTIHQQS